MEKPVVKPLPGRPRKKEAKSKWANKPKVDKGKKVAIDLTAGDSDEVAHPRNGSVDSFATSSQYQEPRTAEEA
ncbi:hypothetical protein NLJ89_g2983 [Agrocybe chaxingu]|uniref:Uncharacterized protein n=1 Tax=Agrocybe chaxingu TaxID=84603 RepID=A0A9W8K5T0_9AGAR|nr:hypothetical protein NLJ89_g2983 [Agrocybe chaxingu]